ncbi:uncharacterized protein I206_101585 [Kwoniella pini CBS 10737]|uniref:Uncharacterized protein n=1 Tax=Kwoniella pini CBS 10737 TaxID=1296096 RepID=A0A1B9HW91_9TREE|nr:uncharacterized protein I206_06445 [Kwoniella pini CBS 10737]OCF47544.1 hypothetical protein I206_06445 [Kwoniella pini CBS 10737]
MDELFFFFIFFCGLFLLASIIYCFLSTCLGVQIRRADLKEAFSIPTPAKVRARDAERRRRMEQTGSYELDEIDRNVAYERVGGISSGAEEFEVMRRGGPSRGFF